MSVFHPESYAEALSLAQNRPQKRRAPLRSTSSIRSLNARQGESGARKTASGIKRRTSAIPYGTNSLKARKKGKKAKRVKLPSLKNLKKRVWVQFSIFIRTRDADEFGMVTCATCPARHLWDSGEIHAGHWIHGRLDFDERNIHGQCRNDNFYSHTKVNTAYACFMAKTYGPEVMDELRLLSNTRANKYSRDELNQLLAHYATLNKSNPLVKEQP